MGPENQMGSEISFTLIVILVMIFCLPIAAIAGTDYQEIANAKDSVDKEVKRAITICTAKLVQDSYSSNRVIKIDTDKLKKDIKEMAQENVYKKYQLNFTVDDIDIWQDEKFYVSYRGHINYTPLLFKGKEQFEITITGRSKVQRFDRGYELPS